jgi:hypothetical protein
MEEASSSLLLKESGEGRVEYKYSIPNPTSQLLLSTYRGGVWLQSCFVVWMLHKEGESGDEQTKIFKSLG